MLNLVLGALALVVLVLLFKYLTGKSKPSENRSSLEKIACSLFTIFNRNLDDAQRSIRTARVMKDEALQEVNEALKSLEDSYRKNRVDLRLAKKKLEEVTLPNLRDMPGKLEAKARLSKTKYEESVAAGNPVEAYKQNAYKYLANKDQTRKNIEKAEKILEKLAYTIDTESANYEGRKMDLEMIKANLECMVDIPQVELNQSLNRIRSLQNELNDRMNEDMIRSEVEDELRNENNSIVSSSYDEEFNNL